MDKISGSPGVEHSQGLILSFLFHAAVAAFQEVELLVSSPVPTTHGDMVAVGRSGGLKREEGMEKVGGEIVAGKGGEHGKSGRGSDNPSA